MEHDNVLMMASSRYIQVLFFFFKFSHGESKKMEVKLNLYDILVPCRLDNVGGIRRDDANGACCIYLKGKSQHKKDKGKKIKSLPFRICVVLAKR